LIAAPSAKEVRKALSEYATPVTSAGLIIFVIDIVSYIAAIAAVLFVPWLAVKIIAGIFAGAKMANLATLGHDAAHNILTKSRLLNKWIAIASFTPGLFNYRLWIYDHHNLHHHNTNELHPDSYTPLSVLEYQKLTAWQQFKYRFYRSTSLWSFGIYYIFERWWQVKLFPRNRMPKHVQRAAWPHTIYLVIYFFGFIALLINAPLYSQTSAITAIFCGFLIPFYIFQSFFAFTVFVQHTHPRVIWFNSKPDRNAEGRQDYISVQLKFPKFLSLLMHHVYDHAAHHAHIGIPCYKLPEAQEKLNLLIGEQAVSECFTFAWLREVKSHCKLYDYDNQQWLDFEGKVSKLVMNTSPNEARV
jgi:omega-6 fatty acid desaturase (delta-12 desaturase)